MDALYADVILPLPLAGTFTYALPVSFSQKVQAGCRLIVPFGAKKIYAAIVMKVHTHKPEEYAVKEAMELLDDYPVLLPAQLKLWQWIAEYYLCTLGEVYKAALPSGMKLESESCVVLNPDFECEQKLTETEQRVLDALGTRPEQRLIDLQKQCGVKHIMHSLKHLLEMDAVRMREEVKRNYKPRKETCVRLASEYFDEARINALLDGMGRSPRQQSLLLTYLDVARFSSAWTLQNPSLLCEVSRQQLLEQAQSSSAILKSLCEKGVLETYERNLSRLKQDEIPEHLRLHPLSQAQDTALLGIQDVFSRHSVCLLHGVTSSGKTEVYIHLIKKMLEQGRQVLYLLPEIVLTSQLTDRLRRVFGDRLGVYHSKYPDAERVEIWQKQLSDTPYDIIVGVRSSVFLPYQRLGLVIVDEEHETSFKQQDPAPRYHARNVALVLAAQMKAKTLLGTATPSLETYFNTMSGKYGLVELTERYQQVQMPQIEVVDVKELRRKKMMNGPFSPQLLVSIREALQNREQVILFQNRRGFSPQMECHTCGWVPRCQNCDVSLSYHKGLNQLTCHYCGFTYQLPQKCPSCHGQELHTRGYGTERIEDLLHEIFPEARIARMDLDTTRTRTGYEKIISDFQHGRTDILVGTQMVTKGLDFEHVSVVGILSADTMLNQPDFRSYERAFHMMAQVAGRAGRRNKQGRVVLQTMDTTLPVISQVVRNDYAALYHDQMEERQMFQFPPYCRLIYLYMKHRDQRVLEHLAQDMATLMRRVFGTRVLGPDTPPVAKVQNLYIRKVVLKVELTAPMHEVRVRLRQIQAHLLAQDAYHSAQIYYDVDPQ